MVYLFFPPLSTDKKLTGLIVTFSSCVSVKGSTFLASFLFGPWVLFFSAAIDCVRPRAALRLQDAQLSCPRLMLSAAWPALVLSSGKESLGWFVDPKRTFHHCSRNFTCWVLNIHTHQRFFFVGERKGLFYDLHWSKNGPSESHFILLETFCSCN